MFVTDALVGHPLRIGAVGVALLLLFLLVVVGRGRPAQSWGWTPLAAGLAWIAAAGWEALIEATSPEADIRVDLVLIVPVVTVLSVTALISLLMMLRARPG